MSLSSDQKTTFAVCVDNGNYAASLERWKIYRVVPEAESEQHQQMCVVDESGEDYVYPREYFRLIDLPPSLKRLYQDRSAGRLGSTP